MDWQPLMAKEKAAHSLPDHDNEHQPSINDIWPSMMVNQSARWLLMAIYGVLTDFIG